MIRILQAGDEAVLETYLQPRIESSMFLVSNMRAAGLDDNGRSYQGTYAAAFEQDQIIGVAALFWNGSLIVQTPVTLLADLWQEIRKVTQRPIVRLIGPSQQVRGALEQLKIPPAAIQWDEPENLYSLHLSALQIPAQLRSGEWQGRLIESKDIALMTRWRVEYALEALGENVSPELWQQKRANVEKYLALGHTWILEANGQPVATSSFNAVTKEAVQVGGVWTPPEYRRHGYGRCAVAASLLVMQEKGVRTAVLFTGKENIPAQKAYKALGFQYIGDYRITLLKGPQYIAP